MFVGWPEMGRIGSLLPSSKGLGSRAASGSSGPGVGAASTRAGVEVRAPYPGNFRAGGHRPPSRLSGSAWRSYRAAVGMPGCWCCRLADERSPAASSSISSPPPGSCSPTRPDGVDHPGGHRGRARHRARRSRALLASGSRANASYITARRSAGTSPLAAASQFPGASPVPASRIAARFATTRPTAIAAPAATPTNQLRPRTGRLGPPIPLRGGPQPAHLGADVVVQQVDSGRTRDAPETEEESLTDAGSGRSELRQARSPVWHRSGIAVASPAAILSAERLLFEPSAFSELPQRFSAGCVDVSEARVHRVPQRSRRGCCAPSLRLVRNPARQGS